MKFDLDRCVECNDLLSEYKSDSQWPWDFLHGGKIESGDSFRFCSDSCAYKAMKRTLPELLPGDSQHPEVRPVIKRHLATYRAKWYAEVGYRSQKEQQEREEAERQAEEERLEFEELIKPRPIPERIRSEHTLILGPSGSGKTTLIERLILNDLAKDDPPAMVIIDPKGLLIDRISRLEVFNSRFKDRLVIIDPTTDPPPALNMFDPATLWNRMWSDSVRSQVANQLISTFGYIFSAGGFKLTPKQNVDFSYVVRLLFTIDDATVHTLLDILDDPAKTLEQFAFKVFVARLDSISQRFFRNEFFTEFKETKGQIKARLYMILQHPTIVAALSTPRRKIDLIDCLAKRKIVLVNTSMPVLGSEGSTLLGRFFIAATLNAAFARVAIPKADWSFATLVIDEFQEYADDLKTPELLRLAREYNLGVVMATQNIHAPPFNDALRNTISTNTSIKYAASPEALDLSYTARDMRCDADFLQSRVPTETDVNFACFVRGLLTHPMVVSVPIGGISREPQMDEASQAKLLEECARRMSYSPPEPALSPPPKEKQEKPSGKKRW